MRIVHLTDVPAATSDRFVAESLVETPTSSLRVIRLAPGQDLPPHRHGSSDLDLLVVAGVVTLDGADGPVQLGAGGVAVLTGDEELRASNRGADDVTLVAFLSPPFPPRQG
ncbi:cupin domain-containing protein [Actinotalea sp. Marseille-Q4924]|uniref:cupin domain-containing protein n=1 Tax=Actinotalea sp. Marseille-Q4924 TaxID=2866571 RepID=UPI001CE3BC74|nr:cupin domain-containing protein [Actinotalea sp. Marseille-Q4924]